ncbi:Reverse transcriptase (RNA-dependent DNA polymerase) [Pseudovibrio sp. Ad46]|uniref:retron St85 family RNA-directed DNA polymerase n=1 Tax=unclassified Pseudovibrio TaxID=2627060 RepID=UPI0007AE8E0D|nr:MULTISPECIES: retron St85 family RNA-directed DNA polymerase [unclassified Pseudovibrio]KZK94032.1 Reverse transcriptase (RNA-dependent DNA polymerase) [Pseudovibrio sp. Ad46]KZL01974.1 Reverse transcriptase (RNA-dependent DNA polymerase) [Pseudovibrio sp. Ad5]
MNNVKDWEEFLRTHLSHEQQQLEGAIGYVKHLISQSLPPIFGEKHFSILTGVSEIFLRKLADNSAHYYRTFSIPKRKGGFRNISVPSPTLLHVQRWIVANILRKIPVHEAVHGYVASRSVITNAKVHREQESILRIDIKDFFPTIESQQVQALFAAIGYRPELSVLMSDLCCRNNVLPQGAATSPAISNWAFAPLDRKLKELSQKYSYQYTRYADDIFISGKHIHDRIESEVAQILLEQKFRINRAKTRFMGPNRPKILAGVSIASGRLCLPREKKREIKQNAYYIIKYGLFEHCNWKASRDPLILEKLLGKINFWLMVEPKNPTALELQQKLRAISLEFDNSLWEKFEPKRARDIQDIFKPTPAANFEFPSSMRNSKS